MKYIKVSILFITLIFSTCSLFEEETGDELSTPNNKLNIQNNNVNIYYFAVEAEFAAVLLWAASKNINHMV